MPRFTLHRRALMRGMGGAAMALPALEIMNGPRRAGAAADSMPPRRYIACYGGISIGGYKAPWDQVVPETVGQDYEITRGLRPIEQYQVKSRMGLVSGLKIPWGPRGAIPPGGRTAGFHGSTRAPQSSGMRYDRNTDHAPRGPTSDQIVADAIAGNTIHRSLAFRVQPSIYEAGASLGNGGFFSWKARQRPVQPIVSPRLGYQALFGEAIGATDAGRAFAATLERRRSILDLVRDDARRLIARLGRDDRRHLQQHFDEITDLERRLRLLHAGEGAACLLPAALPGDPPIGGSHEIVEGSLKYTPTAGWSNEELRAEILCDFIRTALACDLTRVATVLFTLDQSAVNMERITGVPSDLHGLGHYFKRGLWLNEMADAVAWHVKHFARLVAKLGDVREVDGSSLLDHTALVMFFEGGQGWDPEGDPNGEKGYHNGTHWAHSSENMIVIVGGGAGGLKSGQHISAPGAHPAQVVLTAMNAVGVPGPLGDISEGLPALFTHAG